MDSSVIDPVDARIIDILRHDGRMSWRELSERIHLAPSSVAERVRRLELRGVITGYSARVDPVALGRTVRAVIDVSLGPGDAADDFEERLRERDEVVMAAYVTGSADYTIVAECVGAEGLDAFVRWVRADHAVARTESKLMLRSIVG
ncbi:Lrp/AsnC family transcriptional regulator [Ilumatobacter coccineus]|uniref:Putative AsnC family transcriptional regulator n=1 Tax=Ilumatobacter coccineus (strain NBRC 103263 / KCTC 29153 / YM16-304) TaxID=1313172 RepID=A0A6C7EBH8_ILUCY|nr:Lrp/AsnC family transcriptional regulator [Ilumatobacter coccineus]BAN02559.1 putative AsnC family transcriptional regulator [Ilumatobacter coccineus YM16-304]